MKSFLAGVLGAVCIEGITLLVLLIPEPNRIAKRVLSIPAELSGPHRYTLAAGQDAAIRGSANFAYCALSGDAAKIAGCDLSRLADGWHVRAAESDPRALCAVTCLK